MDEWVDPGVHAGRGPGDRRPHRPSGLMARLKKGDTVTVLAGKDRGKSGKILQVFPDPGKALVERLNLLKHFERRSQQAPEGGVVEREGPLPLARLALVCPRCRRPVRVGWIAGAEKKQRICRRCKTVL